MTGARVLWAGLLGGALAGLGDAASAISRALLQASHWNPLHLLGLGCSLGAALGLGIATLALLVARVTARVPKHSASLTAMAVAAPLVVYDAFALFSGAKAARIPGHQAISVAIIVFALALIGLAARLWRRWLAGGGGRSTTEDTETEGRGDGMGEGIGSLSSSSVSSSSASSSSRSDLSSSPASVSSVVKHRARTSKTRPAFSRVPLMALGLFLAAAGAHVANMRVLPRLYSWFHMSLALLTVVACVLAVLILLGRRGRVASLVAGFLVILGLGGFEIFQLGSSQSLRFFAFEKTQIIKQVLRVVPVPRAQATGPLVETVSSPTEGLPEGPRRRGADVILITVDAARADHVGVYGHSRPTTPNIDALARQGVRFERAYAQAPHTSFSIASMLTGTYYATLARLAPNGPQHTLAQVLRTYGWKTAAFFPPAVFFIDAHKMKTFENSNFDFEYVKNEYLDAQQRIDQIEAFLRQEDPRRLFLWLHLFEPHEPYLVHPGHDFGTRDIDRYDSEIAYCDEVLGKVIALIQKRRPDSIIIVAADHGEEFDDHGGRYHGTTLYEEQVRVPLVMFVPGLSPRVLPGPVQLIDIAPTILGLLDLMPPARMRGTDLGPWLATPPAPADRFPPVFSEVEDKRMVVDGQDKLVCNLAKDYCATFDLATDPLEQHDLAEAQPKKTARLRRLLDDWLLRQARLATKDDAVADNSDEAQTVERGRLGDPSVAGQLAAMLTSSAPLPLRRQAARALVEILVPRPETKDALRAAVESADDDEVRDWAAVAAVRLGEEAGKERAQACVNRAGEESLRLHAALALAQSGDSAGVKILGETLKECTTREALCKSIVTTLGKLRDPAAVPALIAYLPDVRSRWDTVKALGEIASPASAPALIERLKNDEYVPVRINAARALARIGGARALLALQWSATHDPEPRVAEAAKAAVTKLRRGR